MFDLRQPHGNVPVAPAALTRGLASAGSVIHVEEIFTESSVTGMAKSYVFTQRPHSLENTLVAMLLQFVPLLRVMTSLIMFWLLLWLLLL